MKITNKAALRPFRLPGPCEWCGRPCQWREPAHVQSRGAGGSDIEINLVGLGGFFQCGCHRLSHDGHRPLRIDLEAVVAARLGIFQDQVRAVVELVWRTPKECSADELDAMVADLLGRVIKWR